MSFIANKICGLVRVADPPFDQERRFTTSWSLPPWGLIAIRFFIFLYTFFSLIIDSTTTCPTQTPNPDFADQYPCDATIQRRNWVYFTNLSWFGLVLYFLSATILTIKEVAFKRQVLSSSWKIVGLAHSFLYTTIVVFPLLVTGMYWTALVDGSEWVSAWSSWNNISFHMVNIVLGAIEIVVPRTKPMPWWHLIGLYVVLGLYTALTYVNFRMEAWWPYPFLGEMMKVEEGSWKWPLAVIIGVAVAFVLMRYCIVARRYLTRGEQRLKVIEMDAV